jgi:hypothetical protein
MCICQAAGSALLHKGTHQAAEQHIPLAHHTHSQSLAWLLPLSLLFELPPLFCSAISNAILEAAKRRAQEQQAAAAQEEAEPGEADAAGSPRKRPKHEPIVWRSPSQQQDAAAGDK